MESRYHHSAEETSRMNTESLRKHFLVQDLLQPGQLNLVYSHYDRMIMGGVAPSDKAITLHNPAELRAAFFLERRELGMVNVGGSGTVVVDQQSFPMKRLDGLYVGKGAREIVFHSDDVQHPAQFFLLSAPAHQAYPVTLMKREDASPLQMGEQATANRRTIYKYIHAEGIQSCQLVMGLTVLESGSVWNTMPAHTHSRRMEVYFYFDVEANHRVMHFMGAPSETRHLIVANHEAIISPPWSIHSGCGTSAYGFIWGMAGENSDYTDMDMAPVNMLK